MQKKLLMFLSIIFVMMTTFAYSALSTSLAITSEVKLRPLADIRVNAISLNSTSGGAIVQYESDYSKNSITSGFTLPNANSSISYNVRIDNSGDVDYAIYNISTNSNNNGIQVDLGSYNLGDVIPARSTLNLVVTYTTTDPNANVINATTIFDFRKVFYITYSTGTSQTIAQQIKYENVNLTLSSTVPTKTGYTFNNWNTRQDGTGVNFSSGATYTLNESNTLYAMYTASTYNISYTMRGGPDPATKPTSATYDDVIQISNPGNKTFTVNIDGNNQGATVTSSVSATQTFAGWTSSTLGSNAKRGTTSSPTTSWDGTSTTNTYFKNLNESGTVTMVANWNSANATLPSITKTGHTCGYSTTAGGNIEYSAGDSYPTDTTTDSTTLYAKCVANTYTIQYCVGNNSTTPGYTCSATTSSHTYDIAKNLTEYSTLGLTTPTGWRFGGWTTSPTSTSYTYADEASVVNLATTPGETINLYAVYWKKFIYFSGENYDMWANQQYYNPYTTSNLTSITIDSHPTAIANWTAVGYRTDGTAAAPTYTLGQTITPAYNESPTFYAIYSRNLTISYNGNTNTGGSTANTTKTIYLNADSPSTTSSQEVTLATNTFTKTNYLFDKWAEGSTSGTQYAEGATYNPNLAYNAATFGATMYALWTPITYTVQYCQGNNSTTAGYTCSATTSTHTIDVVQNLTAYTSLGLTAPTGWTFYGWTTDANGSTTRNYEDGASVVNLANTPNTTVNLYAVYRRTLDCKSGVNRQRNTTPYQYYNPYRTDKVSSITMPTPRAVTNWTALGYRTDTTASTATYTVGQSVTPAYNEKPTYYAVYSRDLTISYNGNSNTGGSTSNTTKTIYMNTDSTTTSSQEVTLANNGFTKTNYVFDKWAEGSASGTQYAEGATYNPNLAYNAASFDINMYALWTPITYTVQYCQGNNSTTAGYTCSATTSTHIINLAQNLKAYTSLGLTAPAGWTFYGWTTDATGSTTRDYSNGASVVNLTQTGGTTVNLYAVFRRYVDIYAYGDDTTYDIGQNQYYNPYTTSSISQIVFNESYNPTNWTPLGFRDDTTAADAEYALDQSVTPAYNETSPTYYEVYSRDLTIHYNGNGNTGGSTQSITKPIYLNSYFPSLSSSQAVTLATNGFTKDGYSFVDWTEGSTSGTHYNAGATYDPNLAYDAASFDITMYANWLGRYYNILWDYNYHSNSIIGDLTSSDFTGINTTSLTTGTNCYLAKGGKCINFTGAAGNVVSIQTNTSYTLSIYKTYNLTFFAKTSNSSVKDLSFSPSGGSDAPGDGVVELTTSWQRYSLTFTSMSYTGPIEFLIDMTQSATISLHSIELTEVSAANGLIYDDYSKTMEFDGVDDWWNMGVRNSSTQTVDATFKTQSGTAPTDQYILGNWEAGGGGIFISPTGYLCGNYYITEEAAYKSACTSYKAQANTWYHLGLTYDGSALKLYVNGELVKTTSSSGTIGAPTNSTVMSLGSNPSGTSGGTQFFKGTIKSARVYNTAKDAGDIMRNYLFDQGDTVGGCVAAGGLVYNLGEYDTNVGIPKALWSRRANEAIGSVQSVSRTGYTFDGWYTDPAGGTKVTADTIMPNHTLKVYAHWKKNTTVTFSPVGGTVSPTTKTVNYNSPYGELPTPTRSGYYFGGWHTGTVPSGYTTLSYITGDGSHYIDTGYYTNPNTYVKVGYKFTSVTPVQQRIFGTQSNLTYQLYINGNGIFAYAYNDDTGNWPNIGVTATTSRYTLDFNKLESGVRKVILYNEDTGVVGYSQQISGTATKTSTDTLKILANGAGGSGSMAKARIYSFQIYETNTMVHNFVPVRRNSDNVEGLYDRIGQRFHALDHTITDVDTNMVTSTTNVSSVNNHTLYARWSKTQSSHVVTYNCSANGGDGVWSGTAAVNSALDLTDTCDSPPSGFTFVGWNTNSTATEALSSLNMGTSDVTLYGIYRSSSEYTATFNLQDTIGISTSGGTTSCYRYNGASSCNITAPTIVANPGSTVNVVGWNETANSHTASYSNGAAISIDSNQTYYSITQRTFDVNFNRNSHVTGIGSAGQDQSSPCTIWNNESACSVTSPSTLIVDTGYKAVGFNTDANATTSTWNLNTSKNIMAPLTYYCIAKGIDYKVKFNANCPSGVTPTGTMSDQNMVYGTAANLSANEFSCSGYSFLKWTTNADGTGTEYINEQSVNNLTTTENDTVNLYAQWGQLWAENIAYDNTSSGVSCTDTQCMLDYLADAWDHPDPSSFATDSWYTIARTAKNNPTFYPVGATKTVQIDVDGDNTAETYTLRVANNTTPSECEQTGFSQTACGFVVEFQEIIASHQMNPAVSGTNIGTGNNGGWEYSEMRAYINNGKYLEGTASETDYSTTGIYNKLPRALRYMIIPTTVVSGYGVNDSANFVTTDKLYLLDAREVYGTSFVAGYNKAKDSERQLDYYLSQGVTTSNYGATIKTAGTAKSWWLRSANASINSSFFFTNSTGSWQTGSSPNNSGISPAFRLG